MSTTDTGSTIAFFIGGSLDGQQIQAGPDHLFCTYRDEAGEPVDPQTGDDEFGFGRLGHRTPTRFYRSVPTGIGFDVGMIHWSAWPDWERASFGDHQAILLHRRYAPRIVVPPQQLRRDPGMAGGDELRAAAAAERRDHRLCS